MDGAAGLDLILALTVVGERLASYGLGALAAPVALPGHLDRRVAWWRRHGSTVSALSTAALVVVSAVDLIAPG